MELELSIDGVIESQDVAPNESLLTLLRREGHHSVKQGCETGECGACTVLIDGVPRVSCVMLAAQAGGCSITTVEKLGSTKKLHPLQEAFIEVGAASCGFCSSGMLLSAYALLQQNASPTEDEVRAALSGNLCRCSGYEKPVQAVLRAATVLRGEKTPFIDYAITSVAEENTSVTGHLTALVGANGKLRSAPSPNGTNRPSGPIQMSMSKHLGAQVVGRPLPLLNAPKMVTGRASFAADYEPRGTLYARVLTSPYAHAIIRTIDASVARALPGVHAVLTYKDVPRHPFATAEGLTSEPVVQDHYSLDYIVRYVGDRVAVVAADTPEIAEQALDLIQVEYDIQSGIFDPRQALESSTIRIHPESDSRHIYDASRNIAMRVRADYGDVEQGFAGADVIVEGEYLLPPTQPVSLEPHSVLTYFDEDDTLVVRTSTQVPHYIRRTLAQLLDLPLRRIRVEKPEIGGNLGARQEIVLEDLCALLTLATHRPVRLVSTRTEEFLSNRISPQHIVRLKTGVMNDGTIVANQLMILADTGAYATHPLVLQTTAASALSLYPCPNMRFVAEVLYSNHQPAAADAGLALTVESFALEVHIDEIARRLHLDAISLRQQNWIKTGATYRLLKELRGGREQGQRVESCGLPTCLQIVEEKLQWAARRGVSEGGRFRRGIGIALVLHGQSGQVAMTSGAIIKLSEDGSFDVFGAINDGGNGSTTQLAQLAAEALGVSLEEVVVHNRDTDIAPTEVGVSPATVLYSSGGAILKAAEQLRRQILTVAGRMLNVVPESLAIQKGLIVGTGEQQVTKVALSDVAAYALANEGRHLMATASWKGGQTPTTFAVQGAEVEVDTENGCIKILRIITAIDAGRVLNPLLIEAQVEGGVVQGLGLATSDELFYESQGRLLNTSLRDYHLYTAAEMPKLETYLVETTDPTGPLGAKSSAEIGVYGVAPAIVNAVAHAIGTSIYQLPLTPERILRAIHIQNSRRAV
ncbi:molybdopterin-dependent oxidoreductase [Tengunoibacter tsumagoiensis]|uniref:Dehydrogenase n=1 Tax=Tengunoibacter tsumagoiensis TaxID=2014871 RepID=A0A401ZXK5_9CHLR|nr:molybdopterin cofactor-binding domain-containing protein [Tengunoibacter tsumagoiensis]GCE11586.1 dehydrogenase [Tengunoibacter tsumagoiensis]